MKCPKCGYLGFENVDRCRNCGYDFSLAEPALPELPMRSDATAVDPLDNLALVDAAMPPVPESRPTGRTPSELPLFSDDVPLITRASPPRQPLAVRRASPEVPRVRLESPRAANLDLRLDLDSAAVPQRYGFMAREGEAAEFLDLDPAGQEAGLFSRLVAACLDFIILAAVDAVVVYFTMQICGVTLEDFDVIPKGPLIAFLIVQNFGYLVAFTAGGQTLGKMAMGIRVVPNESDEVLDLGRALKRTFAWLVLAVPAGLGFITALFSRDHRGLHDRFAGTRVVRV